MPNSRIDQYYNKRNRNIFSDKSRSHDRNRSYNNNNQNFRERNKFKDDSNRDKYNIRIEAGHMAEAETGTEIIEVLVGIEEAVELGIEVDQPLGLKVNREGVIPLGIRHFISVI